MKVVSVDAAKLTDLCNSIRRLKKLTPKEKRDALTALLVQADAIRFSDSEQLVCLACATKLRGHNHESTIFRLGESGRIRVYSICHKNYFDRQEILELPPPGHLPTGDRKANRR